MLLKTTRRDVKLHGFFYGSRIYISGGIDHKGEEYFLNCHPKI